MLIKSLVLEVSALGVTRLITLHQKINQATVPQVGLVIKLFEVANSGKEIANVDETVC